MYDRDDPASEPAPESGDLIRYATIKSVDLTAGTCVAEAGDLETGAIRWLERRMGKTRTWSPPSVGEQVLLFCPEGELAAAVVLCAIPRNMFSVPGNSLRELISFEDGALIAYDPTAHVLDVTLPSGATLNIIADGGLNITGDIDVTGKITCSGDVVGAGISLEKHRHSDVQPGSAQTGKPV